jgi:hypothetical protein
MIKCKEQERARELYKSEINLRREGNTERERDKKRGGAGCYRQSWRDFKRAKDCEIERARAKAGEERLRELASKRGSN